MEFAWDVTKQQLAHDIISHVTKPLENILCLIPLTQFPFLDELFEAEPTQFLKRKREGRAYVIMQLGMVPALETNGGWMWNLIMPTKVKDIIRKGLPLFQKMYQEKKRFPTPEEYRKILKDNGQTSNDEPKEDQPTE